MPSLAGTKLDKYEMLEEVGHGGMAVVYRATDTVLRREVAVKVLHPHLADREESRLRLQREAIAVAKLRHENILEIFDYSGETHDESYIVTEFIHGPTLREWIDESLDPRPAIAALVIFRIARALSHAHRSGIVHRDIKPENVMIRLEDGCLKLMDFGIAQLLDNQKLTLTGQLIGSPAYMAPELISGKPLDARTDLFSLGVMLYQLSTGQLPFSGRNPHEVLNRIADGDYPAPSSVCPLVDRELEAIIATALATNPDDRFQTVDALATELSNYLEEMGVDAGLEELSQYFRKPQEYVADLDRRVSSALMQRAEEASREGNGARAIRLLGRVLELDGAHKDARALLARLRTQERRMRQALLGAGLVGVAGLVAAGILLVPPETDPAVEGKAFAQTRIPAPEGSGSPSETDPRGGGGRDLEPGPERLSSEAALGGTEGVTEPARRDGVDPAAGPGKDGTTPRRPPRANRPARVPETVRCEVKISGISKSQLTNIKFVLDGQPTRVEGLTQTFEVSGNKPHGLHVVADQYEGGTALTPERCKEEVRLDVGYAKASVRFTNVFDNTSVRCVSGCPVTEFAKHNKFPKFYLEEPTGQRVVFEYRVEGYAEQQVVRVLYPGPNTIPLKRPKPLPE